MVVYFRLEAATSRLEDMAMSFEGASQPNHVNIATPVQQTAVEPSTQAPSPPAPTPEPDPPQIEDFDALIKSDVQAFVDLGKQIGGLVGEQVLPFEFEQCAYLGRGLTQ
jgi:adenylyl cyclase-associated protein